MRPSSTCLSKTGLNMGGHGQPDLARGPELVKLVHVCCLVLWTVLKAKVAIEYLAKKPSKKASKRSTTSPYSLDLAPVDFFFFLTVNNTLCSHLIKQDNIRTARGQAVLTLSTGDFMVTLDKLLELKIK